MAIKEQVRQLVSGWLVLGKNGPLILSPSEDKIAEVVDKLKQKGIDNTIIAITVHIERFKEIGRNLVQWKLPEEAKQIGVMQYRNSLVLKTHETGCWEWVREKQGLPKMTYEEMNGWLMDHMKYVTKEMQ